MLSCFLIFFKQYEGGVLEMFLTESQKNYYTAMKKLGTKKPQKVIQRPENEVHALFYDISLSRRWDKEVDCIEPNRPNEPNEVLI